MSHCQFYTDDVFFTLMMWLLRTMWPVVRSFSFCSFSVNVFMCWQWVLCPQILSVFVSVIKTLVPLLCLSTVCLVEIYKLLLWCVITSVGASILHVPCSINKHWQLNFLSLPSYLCPDSQSHNDEKDFVPLILNPSYVIHLHIEYQSYLRLTITKIILSITVLVPPQQTSRLEFSHVFNVR